MTGTAEGLPMDVATGALWQQQKQQQQQQQQGHTTELDRIESVRARLLAISQVEPVGEAFPLEPVEDVKGSPEPAHQGDAEDEFRRKLMSISYVDVPLPAK